MIIHSAHIKSIKADIVAGDISISFSMAMSDVNSAIANVLRDYAGKDASAVTIEIYPKQPPLFNPSPAEGEEHEEESIEDTAEIAVEELEEGVGNVEHEPEYVTDGDEEQEEIDE